MGTIIVIGLAKLGGQRSVIPSHQPSASLASCVFWWATSRLLVRAEEGPAGARWLMRTLVSAGPVGNVQADVCRHNGRMASLERHTSRARVLDASTIRSIKVLSPPRTEKERDPKGAKVQALRSQPRGSEGGEREIRAGRPGAGGADP
jgi:hypothetical protein